MSGGDKRFTGWLNMMMENRGFSQAELARAMGVTDAQVSRWRRGQTVPTVRSLQRLADTLGVPRATLDRLAGYPTGEEAAGEGSAGTDPALQAELQVYQAWFGQLLERQVPRGLWRVYVEGCAALAEAMGAQFREALGKAQQELDASPEAGEDEPRPPDDRNVGFRP
ncbi:MAG: helix-turn-helix domain-containing protein [Chloroflexota bacterium]|nr:helix-turn-helix domain-containing protein [Chloroflexota bacterium]